MRRALIEEEDFRWLRGRLGGPNPYEQYQLLENPFPAYGDTRTVVCVDQKEIKKAFAQTLGSFGPGAKRLRINGASGAGKTNILRYLQHYTDEARERRRIGQIYPVYVSAPGENYLAIHEQVVDQLLELFLGRMVSMLQQKPALLQTLEGEAGLARELVKALKVLVDPGTLFDLYEQRMLDIFGRWLKGHKLSIQDLKLVTQKPGSRGEGLSQIDSAPVAIRFLSALLQILRQLDLCEGIVLLFDEFEEIFEAPSRARQSRYAQDLRHLLDALEQQVFFVIATVPEPRDLKQYPALERRLDPAHFLEPIHDAELAKEYVRYYLWAGHEQYLQEQKRLQKQAPEPAPSILKSLDPLSDGDIDRIYGSVKEEVGQQNLPVLPGYFLPRVRQELEKIVKAESGIRG